MTRATKTAVKVTITFTLLAFVLRGVDYEALARSASRVSWLAILACFLVQVVLSLVQAFRWRGILGTLGVSLTISEVWRIALIGIFFSQLLPTSIGGDAIRVWKVHQTGTPLGKAFNSVVLDRIMALTAVVLIATAGVSVLSQLLSSPMVRTATIGALAAIIAGLLILLAAVRFSPLQRGVVRLLGVRVKRLLDNIFKDAAAVLLAPRSLVTALSLSCLIQVAISGIVWILAVGAGARIGLTECIVLIPLVILVSMLPLSIAGWGVREGAMVFAFGYAGVDSATSLAVSVLFGLVSAAAGLPGGFLWLYGRRYH